MKQQRRRPERQERVRTPSSTLATTPSTPPAGPAVTSAWVGRALRGVALCLILGLYALTLAHSQAAPLVYDEAVYLQIAERITATACPINADGAGSPFLDNPPFVMYVAALARFVGGDSLGWLRFVQVTLFTLPLYVAVWLLADGLFGPAAGALALASLYTPARFVLEAAEVKLDVPLATVSALFLLSMYRLVETTRPRTRFASAFACALLAGLACVTKHQGVLVPAIGIVYLLITRWFHPPAARLRPAIPELWIVAGTVAAGALWFTVGTVCGGDFLGALRANLLRTTFQSDEPWFHRSLPVYWTALTVAIGPVLTGGFFASAVVLGKRLVTERRVLLVAMWVVGVFVFCSAIGLRNERYFLPAVPGLAVLVGALASADAYEHSWFLRRTPRLARVLPVVAFLVVATASAVQVQQTISDLSRVGQIGQRSNAYYVALGKAVKATIPRDERVMLSRVQTAYIAERNYYLSEYDIHASNVLALLSNPENRITGVAIDSRQMLRDDMPAAEQQEVWDYVQNHFTIVPGTPPGAQLYRRVSW